MPTTEDRDKHDAENRQSDDQKISGAKASRFLEPILTVFLAMAVIGLIVAFIIRSCT